MKRVQPEKGHSLLEILISLSLFLFLFLSGIQFFGFARRFFFKLKETEKNREAVLLAAEKARIDILRAGLGLYQPIKLEILSGIEKNGKSLVILSRDKEYSLVEGLVSGQTKITLKSTYGIKKGKEICIFDSKKGEVVQISTVNKDDIVLSLPLKYSYSKEDGRLILLKKISLYLDEKNHTIRRKVNNSPSQPLLEEIGCFDFEYQETACILHLKFALKSMKEKEHEISVFLKNIALASVHQTEE